MIHHSSLHPSIHSATDLGNHLIHIDRIPLLHSSLSQRAFTDGVGNGRHIDHDNAEAPMGEGGAMEERGTNGDAQLELHAQNGNQVS
jgi:hypothetical protein